MVLEVALINNMGQTDITSKETYERLGAQATDMSGLKANGDITEEYKGMFGMTVIGL